MKKSILFISFVLCCLIAKSQGINWIPADSAFKLQKEIPKPIFMDVYTNWCGWCKKMDREAFSDPQIVSYINQYFYAVKFNAESRDTLLIDGKKYFNQAPKGSRGQHSYASALGVSGYPSTFFIDAKGGNRTKGAYFQSNQLAPILIFFKEDLHGITDVNQFSTNFKTTFETVLPDSIKQNQINWTNLQDGLVQSKKENKKLWIQTYDSQCISCVVQDSTVYTNPFLADYINKNYIPVKFNAFSKDTVILKNQALINNPADGLYHQLMHAAFKGQKVQSPSIMIFNPKEELVAPVRSSLNIRYAEALAIYFFEDRHLKQEDFGTFIQGHKYQSVK